MGRRTGVSALRNPGGAQLDVNWRGTSGCVFRAYPPAPVKKSLIGLCALVLLGSTISSSLGRAPSETPPPKSGPAFLFVAGRSYAAVCFLCTLGPQAC